MRSKVFGIVGCGHIGKRHAAILNNDISASLAAICDDKVDRAETLSNLYGDMAIHANYDAFLKEDMDVKDLSGERSDIVAGQEGAMSIAAIEAIYNGANA